VQYNYEMNGIILNRVKSMKDLGLDISSTHVSNDHINRVVSKCNKKLGMIKRAIGFNAPQNVSKTLYSALVRSDLDYCSSLWSGTSERNICLVEGIQKGQFNSALSRVSLQRSTH